MEALKPLKDEESWGPKKYVDELSDRAPRMVIDPWRDPKTVPHLCPATGSTIRVFRHASFWATRGFP